MSIKCSECDGLVSEEIVEAEIDIRKVKGYKCEVCGLFQKMKPFTDHSRRLVFVKNGKTFFKNKCPVFNCNGTISTETPIQVPVDNTNVSGFPCSNKDCGCILDIHNNSITDKKHKIARLEDGKVMFQTPFR